MLILRKIVARVKFECNTVSVGWSILASPSSNNSWITLVPVVFREIFLWERESELQSGKGREKKNFKKNLWDQGTPGCAHK